MSARHAVRLFWKSGTDTGGNADVPALPHRTNRHYSAESVGRARRGGSGRFARHARNHARMARTLAFLQRDSVNDYLSSGVPVEEPVAHRETEGLGRHDASARATRKTNQRKTAKLFSVAL